MPKKTTLKGQFLRTSLAMLVLSLLIGVAVMVAVMIFFTVRVPDGEKFLMESLSFLFGKQTIGPSRMVPVLVLAGVLLCLMVTGVCILLTSRLTGRITATLGACLLDLIPLAVLVLFFCLINQLVRGSSLTVLLCVVLYIGLLVMGTYLPAVGGLVFTGYLRWHNLWIGIALPFFSLLPRIGLLAGYGLVFGCCGYLLFDRKEA